MQQFSLVYNNVFVFLEPVDELRPIYDRGQLMQGSSTFICLFNTKDMTQKRDALQIHKTLTKHRFLLTELRNDILHFRPVCTWTGTLFHITIL